MLVSMPGNMGTAWIDAGRPDLLAALKHTDRFMLWERALLGFGYILGPLCATVIALNSITPGSDTNLGGIAAAALIAMISMAAMRCRRRLRQHWLRAIALYKQGIQDGDVFLTSSELYDFLDSSLLVTYGKHLDDFANSDDQGALYRKLIKPYVLTHRHSFKLKDKRGAERVRLCQAMLWATTPLIEHLVALDIGARSIGGLALSLAQLAADIPPPQNPHTTTEES